MKKIFLVVLVINLVLLTIGVGMIPKKAVAAPSKMASGWYYPTMRVWTGDNGGSAGDPKQPWNDNSSPAKIYGYLQDTYTNDTYPELYDTPRDHAGMDIRTYKGEPIYALADGQLVKMIKQDPDNSVFWALVAKFKLASGESFLAVYGHSVNSLPIGSTVEAGQQIGTNVTGNPHVHFGINTNTDPSIFDKWGFGTIPDGTAPSNRGWVAPRTWLLNHAAPKSDPLTTGEVSISSTIDKTIVNSGDSITIKNTITNTQSNEATNLTSENVLPYRTSYVSSNDGGVLGTKTIPCAQAANYLYPPCSDASFLARVVRWSGISVGANSSKTLTVLVTIQTTPDPPVPSGDTTKPVVSITSPVNGATVAGTINITVNATDNIAVSQVSVSIDTNNLGSTTTSPYQLSLDTTKYSDGSHTLAFTAEDAGGNTASTSIQITISNNIAPLISSNILLQGSVPTVFEAESLVSLASPMVSASDSSASSGKYVYVPNTATSNGGKAVYKIDASKSPGTYDVWMWSKWSDTNHNSFFVSLDSGSQKLFTDFNYVDWHWVKLGSPLSLTAGVHNLNIHKREAGSKADKILMTTNLSFDPNTLASAVLVDTTAPVVVITSPPAGATWASAGSTQTIGVSASDNVGVTKVEFYINDSLKSTDTTSPYSMSWNTFGYSAGNYTIKIKAYDAAGNIGQPEIVVTLY